MAADVRPSLPPDPSEFSKLLKLQEAAEILRVDVRTIYALRKDGKLPVVMIGSSVRIAPDTLKAYIAAQERREGAGP